MPSTSTARKPTERVKSTPSLSLLVAEDLKRVNQVIIEKSQTEVPLIGQMASHIVAAGGKRLRPALTIASARACGYPTHEARHIRLAAAVEFIHTATLLHDDVVDESHLRRGFATANDVWGNKASVLVGDFLLSRAFQLMVADGSLETLRILSDASAIISKGEVMQLERAGNPENSQASYIEVIEAKTAELFAAACEIGAVVADKPALAAPLRDFGNNIGIAFQIVDDALDYAAAPEDMGKSVGDDFHEGKFTLPVIFAYAAGDEKEKAFWRRAVAEREQKEGDLAEAQRILEKHDAIRNALKVAEQYCDSARKSLSTLPDSAEKQAMLEMVDFCLNRAY